MTRRFLACLAACALVISCSSSEGDESSAEPTTVRVLIDTSLESTLTMVVEALEAERSDIDVELVPGASPDLRSRVEEQRDGEAKEGEEADIIIARASDVDVLRAQDLLAGDALVFGDDAVVIATPTGNPAGVDGIDAFRSDADVITGLCDPTTGCGSLALQALQRAGIDHEVDATEPNAVALVLKVVAGEIEAALLLRTQAATQQPNVEFQELPPEINGHVDLSIAALRDSPVITDVVDWLASSAEAGEILRARGLRQAPEELGE
jgi:molybdate transport system substrate-binding protein